MSEPKPRRRFPWRWLVAGIVAVIPLALLPELLGWLPDVRDWFRFVTR